MIDLIALTQGTFFVSAMFFYLGYVSKKYQIRFLLWSIGFIQMLTLNAFYFVAEQGGSILPILKVNFWSLTIIAFGIGMFVLFNHSIELMDPMGGFDGPEEEENHFKKDHFKK